MKYIYYEKDTGEIKIISPAKEEVAVDPYIEVEDAEVEHLHSGAANTFMFYVKPLSRTLPIGKIIKKEHASLNWKSINDWLYLIPTDVPEITEFKITQDIPNKRITITLDEKSREAWRLNGFYQRSHLPIAACVGPDPHKWAWVKMLESKELLEDITFTYEGTDNIRFYTHRFFDFYHHEQLT
jgi:hypothetical protein